jgi:hypothetical protein
MALFLRNPGRFAPEETGTVLKELPALLAFSSLPGHGLISFPLPQLIHPTLGTKPCYEAFHFLQKRFASQRVTKPGAAYVIAQSTNRICVQQDSPSDEAFSKKNSTLGTSEIPERRGETGAHQKFEDTNCIGW